MDEERIALIIEELERRVQYFEERVAKLEERIKALELKASRKV